MATSKLIKQFKTPDFSTYNNRTVCNGVSQSLTFSEDRFVIGWIVGTGTGYAVVYDGTVEVISCPKQSPCAVSFVLKAGHQLRTNNVGEYHLNAWKMS